MHSVTPPTRPAPPCAPLLRVLAVVLLLAWVVARHQPAHPSLPLVIGYFGPETVMPLASIVTVIAGVILAGWKWLVKLVKRLRPRKRD